MGRYPGTIIRSKGKVPSHSNILLQIELRVAAQSRYPMLRPQTCVRSFGQPVGDANDKFEPFLFRVFQRSFCLDSCGNEFSGVGARRRFCGDLERAQSK